MTTIKLDDKIVWRKKSEVDIAKNFYPSAYKEVVKRERFLNEIFKVKIVDADEEKLCELFFPLYFQNVASKENFTLSRKHIVSDITKKIEAKGYKFMFIYFKEKVVFAWLFCLKNTGLYMAYRAFDRNFDKTISRKTPVSYWAEKMLFIYGKKQGVSFFSHGKDSHPYIGKSRIGLPLYKIKTGVKPRKPSSNGKSLPEKTFTEKDLKENAPLLFFSSADENGFYKNCHLYFSKQSLPESYLKEFERVMAWAGISFFPISF